MKNVIKIFLRDMKKMVTSPFALIILCGLIILPSLYAWLNIEASWNPYDRTNYIKIAVSNNDKGADFSDLAVNIGADVEKELKANEEINWVFLNEKEVRKGVENGLYYAGVIIPPNFSKDFLSITKEKIKKPSIEYIINDKMNAIAPKITDAGVKTLHSQINENFIQVISEKLLIITKKIDKVLSDTNAIDHTTNFLEDTSDNLDNLVLVLNSTIELGQPISKSVDLIDDSLTHLEGVLSNTNELISDGQKELGKTEQLNKTIVNAVSLQFDSLRKDLTNTVTKIDSIIKKIESSEKVVLSDLEFLSSEMQNAIKRIEKVASDIQTFNQKLPVPITVLDKVYNDLMSTSYIFKGIDKKIDTIEYNISSGKAEKILVDIKSKINRQIDIIDDLKYIYVNTVSPMLVKMQANINSTLSELKVALNGTDAGIGLIKDTLNGTDDIHKTSTKTLKSVKELIVSNKKQIDKSVKLIRTEINKSGIETLIETISKNPTLASDFFSDPVKINEVKLYEMANYGSAMSPFYLVLCLWVGGMFLMSVLKMAVKEDKKIKNIKRREEYFGRGLTFSFIAIIQGVVASIGGMLILDITVASPVEFVLTCIYTSIVFSIIIYGLVAGLGNIGKAITIVLLVLQVAGAGGTFPVELTPDFFGKLNPLFPFTYAINAVRETVGGITPANYTRDLLVLTIFIPIGLLIGLLLHKKFKVINEYMNKKMEETDVMI